MIKCRRNVLEAIGATPLVRLNRVCTGLDAEFYVKLESQNPGGSFKDRIALSMVETAEREGLLKPGGTIVEATAGNTGVGLALVAAVRGYRAVFVMPDKMSQEKVRLLRAYGADVVITRTVPPDDPDYYQTVAARLARETPGAWYSDQFSNPANPATHARSTGPEIWDDTGGAIDVFVTGMGTTGLVTGTGRYLKERKPSVRVVAVDPEGSVLSGGEPHPYKIEGIGGDKVPSIFDAGVVDEMIRISDGEAFHMARRLAREEGILSGGSTGAIVSGALRYARDHALARGTVVVMVICDTGRNYLSKIYSDEWMSEQGF